MHGNIPPPLKKQTTPRKTYLVTIKISSPCLYFIDDAPHPAVP